MEILLDFAKALTVEDVNLEWLIDDFEPSKIFDYKVGLVLISDLHCFLSAENPMRGSESEIHLQDNQF